MFSPTVSGQLKLLWTSADLVLWSLGIAGAILCAVGAIALWRRRAPGPSMIPVVLAVVSYYVCFVAVVGYVYDRFMIPVTLLLSLIAAEGIRTLLRAGRTATALCVVLLLWMGWRAASIDVLLLRDSRYVAEEFLKAHVTFGDVVASIDEQGYSPRLDAFEHAIVRPTAAATLAARARFVVVNVQFLQRFDPDSGRAKWLAWLTSADSSYHQVFRYKSRLTGSAFAWTPALLDDREDSFTNLDKADSEIAIFQLRQ